MASGSEATTKHNNRMHSDSKKRRSSFFCFLLPVMRSVSRQKNKAKDKTPINQFPSIN